MNNLCFYFWLHRSSLLCGLSLVAASRVFFSNCSAWASCCSGLSCCGAQALGECASVAVAGGLSSWGSHAIEHGLSSCGTRGLVAPQHVVSSQIRDQTHVSCFGRELSTTEPLGKPYSFIYVSMESVFVILLSGL